MSVTDVLLAPWRIPVRVMRALDDLAALADLARRAPDPVEVVRERLDALLLELAAAIRVAQEAVAVAARLDATGRTVDATGRAIHDGGQHLLAATERVDGDAQQLITGGERLTALSGELERHLRTFRAAMPRLLEGLDTVEELEEAVETVADTVEPLQGAAAKVGRVTQRFSRS